MDLYAENILDHYRHPRKKYPLLKDEGSKNSPLPEGEPFDFAQDRVRVRGVTRHRELNASCGDEITLELQVTDDHVMDVAWTGAGCAISQAGMSMLAEELPETSLEDIAALPAQRILDLLGVPISARRMKCALLGLHALKNAVHLARSEPPQDWNATIEPR